MIRLEEVEEEEEEVEEVEEEVEVQSSLWSGSCCMALGN